MQNYSLTTQPFAYKAKSIPQPHTSLAIMALTVFWCEVVVMAILHVYPTGSKWLEWFLDAFLLLVLILPTFYFYIYASFKRVLVERIQSQKALEQNQIRLKTVFRTSPDAILVTRLDDGLITEVNDGFSAITGYSANEVIGKTTIQLKLWKDPDDREKMVDHLAKYQELINFETFFAAKNGDLFCGLLSARTIELNGQKHILTVVRNIDKLKDAEKKIKAANRFLTIANEAHALADLMKNFIHEIKEVTQCSSIGTMISDESGKLIFTYHLGINGNYLGQDTIEQLEDVQKEIFSDNNGTEIEKDFDKWRKFYANRLSRLVTEHQQESDLRFFENCRKAGFESVALIPIFGESRLLGHIFMADKPKNSFTNGVTEIIENAVLQLGMAIERMFIQEKLSQYNQQLSLKVEERTDQLKKANKSLKEEIRKKDQSERQLLLHREKMRQLTIELLSAQERERKKIAVELHDSIGHNLAYIKMGIQDITRGYDEKKTAADKIVSMIDQLIRENRTMSFSLSPPSLDSIGIGAALEDLCEKTMEEHDIQVLFHEVSKSIQLDENSRFLVYATSRELIFNVVKHAHAKKLIVRLDRSNGFLTLDVEDDGVGFDALRIYHQIGKRGGFGLFSIRERVAAIGGKMELDATLGLGTKVRVEIPLRSYSQSKAVNRDEN